MSNVLENYDSINGVHDSMNARRGGLLNASTRKDVMFRVGRLRQDMAAYR